MQILSYTYVVYSLLFFIIMILLVLSRDIETNPGPDPRYSNSFSVCFWNLNCNNAHNSVKIPLLQACNPILKSDFICWSETYVDNSCQSDDQLALPGCNLIRADKSSNIKRGGVYISYYWNFTSESNKSEHSKWMFSLWTFFWKSSRLSSEYLSNRKPVE